MKSLINTMLILILIFSVSFAQTFDAPSQSATQSELVIDFGMSATALDSAAADTSAIFSLEDYDGSVDSIFTFYADLASAGTPKTKFEIFGAEATNGTFVLLDTISDSLKVTTPTYYAFDMADKRAKYYKVHVTNLAVGAALTGYHLKIRASKRDF